ncbi:MAG: helix-turn-helix domain-containing protein, partial [Micromonosporaceae bacterium]|nr:helix-turn-helix domain-containing protein [Micromonosporaceae bacterium]
MIGARVDTASRNNSSSLRRALGVLDYLASDPAGADLGELSGGLGLPKPTLLRLLAPLREARLVEPHGESGRYRLGPQTARLGQLYLERMDLRAVAAGALKRLASTCGETAHLGVPDPPWVVYVDKVECAHPVRMVSRIGARQPMHSTALGKAWLAHAGEEAVARVIDAGLERRTPGTITAPSRLREELSRVRATGHAVDDVENERDIRCVAAPLFDHTRRPVAAVSVAGPDFRLTAARVPELAEA